MSRTNRTRIRKADIGSLLRAARLDIDPKRVGPLAEATADIFTLLDSLDAVDLRETTPAFTFRAKWGD